MAKSVIKYGTKKVGTMSVGMIKQINSSLLEMAKGFEGQ
jgi:hypothetical protein